MRRALAGAALVAAVTAPGTAAAHPFGTQPVALISPTARGLRIQWVADASEYRDLARHLKLGPVALERMVEIPAVREYFGRHVRVEAGGRDCAQAIERQSPVPQGSSVFLAFDCGGPVTDVVVRMTLLHDVSEKYVTLYRARTPAGQRIGSFVAGASAVRLDLTGAAAPAPLPAEQPAGARARILAMVQGGAGAIPAWLALGLAFLLGALHALTPGHGKTITAAYLVGSGGTVRQALALGGVVSGTHAVSVVAIGAVAIALGSQQPSGRISAWLEVAAGALMVALGLALLRRRRAHDHDAAPRALPLPRLAAIGIVGGLVPNPDAILVAFLAFQADRWTVGVGLIVAFSLGLALVVLAIALAALRGARVVRRLGGGRFARAAPAAVAAVFLAMGIAVVARGALNL